MDQLHHDMLFIIGRKIIDFNILYAYILALYDKHNKLINIRLSGKPSKGFLLTIGKSILIYILLRIFVLGRIYVKNGE